MLEKRVTKANLIRENADLRKKILKLEQFNAHLKSIEDALRKGHERFSALYDRSLDCVYEIDFKGNLIDANPATLKLFGYDRADIPSISFETLLDTNQIPLALKHTEEVIEKGYQEKAYEYRISVECQDIVDSFCARTSRTLKVN